MKTHPLYRAKAGDFYAVSVREGLYGYVRIFGGCSLGVMPKLTQGIVKGIRVIMSLKPRWYFEFLSPSDDPTEMLRIGNIPFIDENDQWPPDRFEPPRLPIITYYRIISKGEYRRVDQREAAGLQERKTVTPTRLKEFILTLEKQGALSVD